MKLLDFDFWSLLLIIGVVQGVSLCLVLFLKKPRSHSNLILGLLLFIFTANLAEFLLLSSKYYTQVPHLMYATHPLLFLLGPLFYYFVRSYTGSKVTLNSKSLSHLIPFAMACIYYLQWYVQPAAYKIGLLTNSLEGVNLGISSLGLLMALSHICQTLIYTVLSLKHIRNIIKSGYFGATANLRLTFLRRFNLVFVGYWMIQLLGLFALVVFQYYIFEIDFVLATINSIFMQFLSIRFALHPEFLSALNLAPKYGKSSLARDTYDNLLQEIQNLVEKEQVYLDSDLNLRKFSELLSVNRGYVSQVINQEFGYGFTDYINDFRIRKAKELLLNEQYDKMKLFGIAIESGFNNNTSFNRVFKRKTGKTPSDYRKSMYASLQKS